jgi:hypothetical protein
VLDLARSATPDTTRHALNAPSACPSARAPRDRPCYCRPRARYAGVTRFYIVAASAVLRRSSHLRSMTFLRRCFFPRMMLCALCLPPITQEIGYSVPVAYASPVFAPLTVGCCGDSAFIALIVFIPLHHLSHGAAKEDQAGFRRATWTRHRHPPVDTCPSSRGSKAMPSHSTCLTPFHSCWTSAAPTCMQPKRRTLSRLFSWPSPVTSLASSARSSPLPTMRRFMRASTFNT